MYSLCYSATFYGHCANVSGGTGESAVVCVDTSAPRTVNYSIQFTVCVNVVKFHLKWHS